MIKTNELKGIIVANGLSMVDVANELKLAPASFYAKMKKGVFKSNEIEQMIELLNIKDPINIFFAK